MILCRWCSMGWAVTATPDGSSISLAGTGNHCSCPRVAKWVVAWPDARNDLNTGESLTVRFTFTDTDDSEGRTAIGGILTKRPND